jgi:hypothetical protein
MRNGAHLRWSSEIEEIGETEDGSSGSSRKVNGTVGELFSDGNLAKLEEQSKIGIG